MLGAGAGGGFPQWNSNSEACRRARAGDPLARPASQASIAVSCDGDHWFLVNASPDLREQINRTAQLHPRQGLRSSPIAGVVLTNGDVDAVAGLLHLRERTAFTIFAHPRILSILDANPIFGVLDPAVVGRQTLENDKPRRLTLPDGSPSGLRVTPFLVPGKVPLYLENPEAGADLGGAEGDTLGLEIAEEASGRHILYVANCAAVPEALRRRASAAEALFFDGTLWLDDEMIRRGEGQKTGQRMGHISIAGPEGSIAAFEGLEGPRKIFIHINNTNPILLSDSAERTEAEARGWTVAYDGMELSFDG